MRIVIAAIALLLLASAADAAVLHVPADYPTIGAATTVAVSGDEVLVAPGTYHERFALGPGQDGVKIHSESGPALTTIDGGLAGTVVTMTSVGSGTELSGFTITGGGLSPPKAMTGGGIYLSQSSARITNNVITLNGASLGAGIYVAGGAPVIQDNTISNNKIYGGGKGGGIYSIDQANPDIENNIISQNVNVGGRGGGVMWENFCGGLFLGNQVLSNSSEDGAGVFVQDSHPAIQSNEFRSNTAAGIGGGLVLLGVGASVLEKNKIVGNVSNIAAGGVYVWVSSSPTLRGDLVQDNICPHGSGGGIYIDGGSATLDHELLLRNHAAAYGGGVTAWSGQALIKNSTIALNQGDLGGGNVHFRKGSNLTIQGSIVAFSPGAGVASDLADGPNGFVWITCSDVSNNAGGDFVGMAAPPSDNQVISLDPQFCDLANLDLHLGAGSPCVAPQGCLLPMGALPVNCQAVATRPATWGSIKAQYR